MDVLLHLKSRIKHTINIEEKKTIFVQTLENACLPEINSFKIFVLSPKCSYEYVKSIFGPITATFKSLCVQLKNQYFIS